MPLFGSLMPYVIDNGCPVVALRNTEVHFKNLAANNMCSMVVFPLTPPNVLPSALPLPKVNLKGISEKIPVNNDFLLKKTGFPAIDQFVHV